MSEPLFEVLDHIESAMGIFILQRRELMELPGTIVTEVMIDHKMLMSSHNTVSERALATQALALHKGKHLRVLIGGLGLGYTADSALADSRVDQVRVVDKVPTVIGWLQKGLLPLSEALNGNSSLEIVEGDVYKKLLGPVSQTYDVILVDVDHTPLDPLSPENLPFYSVQGQRKVAAHLAPGGVLAVWSAEDDDDFSGVLAKVYPKAKTVPVPWSFYDGEEVTDFLFLACLADRIEAHRS